MRYILPFLLMLFVAPALAEPAGYETPQYSGQSPRFDRELDRRREADDALRASRRRLQNIQRDRRDDLAVDRLNARRSLRAQQEMVRRRDDAVRANQQHILRTNE